ncbi:MAG: hypothetical protein IKA79_04500 [Lentisphaeria bacterium]|nr:hypothetical protein [Lentisphaeria bacterium]
MEKREKNERDKSMHDNDFFREEVLFRSLYREKMEKQKTLLNIPEELDKVILSKAAFSAAQRAEKRKKMRVIFSAAASVAVMTFAFILFYDGEKTGSAGIKQTAGINLPEKQMENRQGGKKHSCKNSANWEYSEYTESNDAVNYELISLSSQLDMAVWEAEITSYRS